MFEHESPVLQRIKPLMRKNSERDIPCGRYIPDRLNIQWHITDRCNLKCRHCYIHDTPLPEAGLEQLNSMLQNYIHTLRRMNIKGRINITGGEPFLRKDFFDFLELVNGYKEYCTFGVMCNGTMISDEYAAMLKELGCSFIQVSMDGGIDAHDNIRGRGSFVKTFEGIRKLKKHGLPVSVSFTAGKDNYREFHAAADAARKAGAVAVWTDRVIPERGHGETSQYLMNDDDVISYLSLVNQCRKKFMRRFLCRTGIGMGRALQFMFYDGSGFDEYPYRCSAGSTVLTVLADGRIVPCRRMPVIVGDLKTDDLYDVYHKSELLTLLRDPINIPDGCGACSYSQVCNGGLKCLSYAIHGNPFIRDPQCTDFLMEKRINRL